MVTPDKGNPVTISTQRRGKGLGSGRIQWRTVTKKNGKHYQQAWYDWQTTEAGKTRGKSVYIPKRLLAKVQALEAAKAPVQEVLRVLGVRKQGVMKSKSPKKKSQTIFLGEIEEEYPAEQKSPKKKSRTAFLGEIEEEYPAEQKSPKKNPSGHISPVIQRKKDKSGQIVEYPKIEGERVPIDLAWDYPHQFIWIYNWSVKEDGSWKNRSKSVPRHRIYSVRSAISSNQPVSKILSLIDS